MRWRQIIALPSALVVALALTAGCSNPDSVDSLLHVVDQVLADEQRLLNEDAERQTAWLDQQRQTLAAAFDADMRDRDLTIDWVRRHTAAYVAARDALTEHSASLEQQRQVRLDNLAKAQQLQQRARKILQRHDEVLGVAGNLRDWFDRHTTTSREENR